MDWEKLLGILKEQSQMLETLLELHEQERIALCRLDTAMLEEVVAKKELLFSQFKKLEQGRIELCKTENLDAKPLKNLIEIAPREFSNKFAQLRKELKKNAEKLDSKSKMNNSLIINAQLQTDMLINIIAYASTETYNPDGKFENRGLSTMTRTI